ncbi:hypothetical protein FRB99_003321 [Tulasnella sp. 403]|nr:hypothetical protein FRB99_003321 [Tulasnella sp. 403]
MTWPPSLHRTCSQSIYHSVSPNSRRIFVVFDTIEAARAATLVKGQNWHVQPLALSPEDVVAEFNKSVTKSNWQSRHHEFKRSPSPEARVPDRSADRSADGRFVADNGWESRRRPSDAPIDYGRRSPGAEPTPPATNYRDPAFSDLRERPTLGSTDDASTSASRPRSPVLPDYRRGPPPPSPSTIPPERDRYGEPGGTYRERRVPDYPPVSYTAERDIDRDGPSYPSDDRYRPTQRPPSPGIPGMPWGDRRRPYESTSADLDMNKRLRLSEPDISGRSYAPTTSRDYPPEPTLDAKYRSGPPPDPLYRPPSVVDDYRPGPVGYRSRESDEPYVPSSSRGIRDEDIAAKYRSGDDYGYQYPPGGSSYPTRPPSDISSYRAGPPPLSGGYSPDEPGPRMRSYRPPDVDYPYRGDERRIVDSRDDYPRRYVEPPVSRYQDDPRRYGPPPDIDDRRYGASIRDERRYDPVDLRSDWDRDREYRDPRAAVPPHHASYGPTPTPYGSGTDPRDPRFRGYDPRMDVPPMPLPRDDYHRRDERYDERARDYDRPYDRERDRDRYREKDRGSFRDRGKGKHGDRFEKRKDNYVSHDPGDGSVSIFVSNLPQQVAPQRFRTMFTDIVGEENVVDVNTGRAGFAFVRIRDRPNADLVVAKLHHVEYAPKFKMNVSIGKPPHEYKKQKHETRIKRNKVNETKPRKGAKKRPAWGLKDSRGKSEGDDRHDRDGENGHDGSKDGDGDDDPDADGSEEESILDDADGVEMSGPPNNAPMSQVDIDAFIDDAAKEDYQARNNVEPYPAVPSYPAPGAMSEADQFPLHKLHSNSTTQSHLPEVSHDNDADEARAVDELEALVVEAAQAVVPPAAE